MSTSIAQKNEGFAHPPWAGLVLLWLIACGIAIYKLGELPLRDFDEATVARVAFELSQKNGSEILLPTLWGNPYLNKPPGLHWLIALSIHLSNSGKAALYQLPNETVIRLVPALISTLIVPLGGLIQWNLLKGDKTASLSTAAILLTLLPIARHGRLAMLDGPQLSAMGFLWLQLIIIRKEKSKDRQAFWGGIACSIMLMLKAPFLLPAAFAALIPILWEGKLKRFYKWPIAGWLSLGLSPGISWHLWHSFQRGAGALWLWSGDGATRVLFSAGEGSDLGWKVPLIELLEGGWPWLLLWPFGIALAWKDRQKTWGKWALGTQFILAITIYPLKTQLPWYSHPLWLPFSIICGATLSSLINGNHLKKSIGISGLKLVPYIWLGIGSLLLFIATISVFAPETGLDSYNKILFSAGSGWLIGAWLLTQPVKKIRCYGAITLVAGNIASLGILMGSSFWIWELNENWPVAPVAELARKASNTNVAIHESIERPSLNWYTGIRIKPLRNRKEATWVLTKNPKLLNKENMNSSIKCETTDTKENWTLLSCK